MDLNIENYNLDELLKLFSLSIDFNENDLKNAKKQVHKTHPDKSGLPKEYYIFFAKAFKYVFQIYEFKKRSNDNITEYKLYLEEDDNSKENDEIIKNKIKEKKDFNKWFNTMFNKYNIKDANDDGYGEWLAGDDNNEILNVNKSNLHNKFDDYKKTKIQTMTIYNEIDETCNTLSCGSSNIVPSSNNFSNNNIFKNYLNYEDVKKAHTETFIPVTIEDYNKKKKYNSVFEMNQDRGSQDIKPLTEEQSRNFLNKKKMMNNDIATQNAYYLLKKSEQVKKNNNEFMKNLQLLK